jgi:hypothetical protein
MMALLLAILVFSYGFIAFKLIETKILKYLLTFVISPLYGILLFFIGSFGNLFFILFAILPILIGIFIRFRRK